ncbi:GTP-binding protein [Halegenticoccus tardaugens]|uniref:GTP-binding protein n=1 Tax=Halegenticoccus tardaugens TaxID=2071624 RepID=UPI00100A6B28|nr:GTP-binding protein [Halegenticoccus tardaugens]
MTSDSKIPVTVLSGSLGAGKTTTLNRLLTLEDGRDVAVVVNDVGEVNVDADLVERRADLPGGESRVAALSNGCICCGLRGELRTELVRLAREYEFDYLLVEASGIGEPAPIARVFAGRGPAADLYRLDTTVTVVDAPRFLRAFADGDPERAGPDDGGTRPLADLLVEQVEFCDVLLVNKRDLVADEDTAEVERLLRSLQPNARLVWTAFGEVDPGEILDTGLFDRETASKSAGWKQALERHGSEGERDEEGDPADARNRDFDHGHDDDHGHDHGHGHDDDHDHLHPPEEYGVRSFVYERSRPFHPGRFAALLRDLPDGLLRSKGLVWVAGRERLALNLSQAGPRTRVDVNGRWVASLPEFQRDAYRRAHPDVHWDDEWGDREITLVFIGRGIDEGALASALDDCLLTEEEMDEAWDGFDNPFPAAPAQELVATDAGIKTKLSTTP